MQVSANLIRYNGENIQRLSNLELISIGDILEINGTQFAVAEFNRGANKIRALRREALNKEMPFVNEVIYAGTYTFSDFSLEEGSLKRLEINMHERGTAEFDKYDKELRLLRLIKKQEPW